MDLSCRFYGRIISMLFRLTLQNHMTYRPQEHEPGDFSSLPVGGEIAFACNFRYEDVIFTLDRIWCGERSPLSASEKALLENGDALPERPGYTLEIPAGNYSLLQLPPAEDLPSLRRAAISAAVSIAMTSHRILVFPVIHGPGSVYNSLPSPRNSDGCCVSSSLYQHPTHSGQIP